MAHLERRYDVPQAAGNSSSLLNAFRESLPICSRLNRTGTSCVDKQLQASSAETSLRKYSQLTVGTVGLRLRGTSPHRSSGQQTDHRSGSQHSATDGVRWRDALTRVKARQLMQSLETSFFHLVQLKKRQRAFVRVDHDLFREQNRSAAEKDSQTDRKRDRVEKP